MTPSPDWNDRVAPVRGMTVEELPWRGTLSRKPWDYPVSVGIAHRDTPELLEAVVSLLRAQTVTPYLIVVDTGSGPASREVLDTLDASDDCEVHYLRSKGWRCSSQPVAAAMDLIFAVCQTEYLFGTHTDVFPTRPDMVEHILSRCDVRTPVVGWQMSKRDQWPDESWRSTPSHTATAYHMPTMRSIGATWNMLRAFDTLGQPHDQTQGGYPDTETTIGLTLAAHGITRRDEGGEDDGGRHWLCLGPEPNSPYHTSWFSHVRSSGSMLLYFGDRPETRFRRQKLYRELAAIPGRLKTWAAEAMTPTP